MNLSKYRDIYLQGFTMKRLITEKPKNKYYWMSDNLGNSVKCDPENHPWVNKGIAFWTGGQELCIGWILNNNLSIYRPIFSHKRNNLINKINKDIILQTNVGKIWKKAKSRFFYQLCKIKKIPTVLVMHIVEFTY